MSAENVPTSARPRGPGDTSGGPRGPGDTRARVGGSKSGRFDLGAVLRSEKSFSHPLIGQPVLNAFGLHLLRVKGSDASVALRHRRARLGAGTEARRVVQALREEGVAVCPGFLPEAAFQGLAAEVKTRLAELAAAAPLPTDPDPGFGPKRPFPGGFDRFDGGSLNRFVAIDDHTPRAASWVTGERVLALCQAATTLRPVASKFWIQQLIQSGDDDLFDIQKELHRDTFHAAYKLWYFLDPVEREHGPFEYVPGSQRMNTRRLWWEYAQSTRARRLDAESKNGSFRVSEAQLRELPFPPPRTPTRCLRTRCSSPTCAAFTDAVGPARVPCATRFT